MTELQLTAWGTAAAGVGHTLLVQDEVIKRMECWNSEMMDIDINELDCSSAWALGCARNVQADAGLRTFWECCGPLVSPCVFAQASEKAGSM